MLTYILQLSIFLKILHNLLICEIITGSFIALLVLAYIDVQRDDLLCFGRTLSTLSLTYTYDVSQNCNTIYERKENLIKISICKMINILIRLNDGRYSGMI